MMASLATTAHSLGISSKECLLIVKGDEGKYYLRITDEALESFYVYGEEANCAPLIHSDAFLLKSGKCLSDDPHSWDKRLSRKCAKAINGSRKQGGEEWRRCAYAKEDIRQNLLVPADFNFRPKVGSKQTVKSFDFDNCESETAKYKRIKVIKELNFTA